jgi:hypothetical protein
MRRVPNCSWLVVVFVLLLCSPVMASLAVLRPLDGGEGGVLEVGAQVFTNRDTHYFSYLHPSLAGLPYIRSNINMSSALVEEAGWVYVITPQEGERTSSGTSNSVVAELRQQGYEMTDIPHFQAFPRLVEHICVLRKYVEKGERVEYGQWGITVAEVVTGYVPVKDLALEPPLVDTSPDPVKYGDQGRLWQGIPGIEKAPNGRLWATWYSGAEREPDPRNFVLLVTSADDGASWSDLKVVIDPPGSVRAFDPVLWLDPLGRLWFCWNQTDNGSFDGRAGVWAIVTDEPHLENPTWSEPRRLANGIMMNKPTVLSTGEWVLPAAVWSHRSPDLPEMAAERFSNVYVSTDAGETWTLRGGADVPQRNFDEHMVVERNDGSLWMLVRTDYGIGQSFSYDRGVTWTAGENSGLTHPSSRFHIRRLTSGRLLLIHHRNTTSRTNLTASLSEDDGRTWTKHLLLDDRGSISYPDAIEDADGTIYVIYDRSRQGEREILMTTFTEEDILAGAFITDQARKPMIVNKLTGKLPDPALPQNSDGVPFAQGAARLLPFDGGIVLPLALGEKIWSDRDYVFSNIPQELLGMSFIRSRLGNSDAMVTEPGYVYVITRSESNLTVSQTLEAAGFEKTNIPAFIPFAVSGEHKRSDTSSVYQKYVKVGEYVKYGSWGITIFAPMP